MTFEEFLVALSAEAPRAEELEVFVAAPELLNDAVRAGPLAKAAIEKWMCDWPRHQLPPDLRNLLRKVDGVHLWADLDVGC